MSFRPSLLFAAGLLLLVSAPAVSAAASSGDLIKASGPAVYYYAANGKRYVFPTDKTYFTWYKDFSRVKTVSDAELASDPLGGNVTEKPGVRLVKITTDPKTYYVSNHGTLRWIKTEDLAKSIYGNDWAKKVDDIPDPFFINYTIGSPLSDLQQYQNEIVNAPVRLVYTINDDILPPTTPPPLPPPAATTTPQTPPPPVTNSPNPYAASLILSRTSAPAGATFNALASGKSSMSSVSNIKILFNNSLQKSCDYSAQCSGDIAVPTSGTLPQYEVRAEITWLDLHLEVVTTTLTVTDQANLVTMTLRPEVRPNTYTELVANVDSSFIAKYLDIYVDGGDVHGCNSAQQCRYLFLETSPIGTAHPVYAVAQDANGIKKQSAVSSYAVVADDHPRVSFLPAKNTVAKGETLDLTVSATDDEGVAWTEVWLDGNLLKHCASSSCAVTAGPWNTARPLNFVGTAQDMNGLQGSATSTGISVQ